MADYYKVLDVEKNATDEDIKKAFREKSKQFHPDTTTDEAKKKELEEKFKEINLAYQVLSDPQERAAYDNPPQSHFNFNPFGGHSRFDFTNISDLFSQMNGGQFHFSSTTQINREIDITLLNALLGNEMEIPLQNGKTIRLKLPADFKIGNVMRIRMNDENNPNNTTIINLRINVAIPNLSEDKKAKIKEILS